MAVQVRLGGVGMVHPGTPAVALAWVANRSQVVETFHLDVVGEPRSWATLDPPSVSLLPGEEASVTITFDVPEASRVSRGSLPWGLRARAESDPAGTTVEEAELQVEGVSVVVAELLPETVRARRRSEHRVVIENRGNKPAEVALAGRDKDEVLDVLLATGRLTVPAGEAREVPIRVRSRQRGRAHHPFTVEVTEADGDPTVLRGALDQRSPARAPWLALAAALALVAVIVSRTGSQVATSIRSTAEGVAPEAPGASPAGSAPLATPPGPVESVPAGPADPAAPGAPGATPSGAGDPAGAPAAGGATAGPPPPGGDPASPGPGAGPAPGIVAPGPTPATSTIRAGRPPGPAVSPTSSSPASVEEVNGEPQRVRVTLSWRPPSDTGGSGLTGYRIRCTLMLGSSPYTGPVRPAPCVGGADLATTAGTVTSFQAEIERVEPGPFSWVKWEIVALSSAGAGPAAAAQVVVPNLVGLKSWKAYPYARAVGIALGGGQRSCGATASTVCEQSLAAGAVVPGGTGMTAYEQP